MTTVTAKSTGQPRYCQKCHTLKPDRAHHCSSCGRCVLKMDHHCPWLATCVGLHNYKPFLLFLLYTSVFCWLCFGVSASWVWAEIIDERDSAGGMQEGMRVVNTILLAVLGGIIGLVLSAFTGWHVWLAVRGQTTIESLEKTRYLAPLRRGMEGPAVSERQYVGEGGGEMGIKDQLKEIHANALPGVLRPEEGEDDTISHPSTPPSSSPAKSSLQHSYASLEAQRERDRYTAYLDELDSEQLPNAFDLGWKRNLRHVFGDRPLLWGLPVCNTSGDGWAWEINPSWEEARAELAKRRDQRRREEEVWGGGEGNGASQQPARQDYRWTASQGFVNQAAPAPPPAGRSPSRLQQAHTPSSSSEMQLQPLDCRKGTTPPSRDSGDNYDTSSSSNSSDEEVRRMYAHPQIQGWNDVPEEYLGGARQGGSRRSRSRGGRRKGD